MNIKSGQQVIDFDVTPTEYSKSSPFQSYRGDRPRMSYGGGFHMGAKHTPTPVVQVPEASNPNDIARRISSPDGRLSLHVIEEELERLKMQSQSIEKMRQSQFVKGILHLDPPNHSHSFHADHDMHSHSAGKRTNLEELEVLKEKNAARLVEIEAQMARAKQEDYGHGYKGIKSEFISVIPNKKHPGKKERTISDYQRKYQEKFEKYVSEKEKKRIESQIKGKEMKVSESSRGKEEESELLETKVLLKWIFKKLDKDHSGMVDKVELFQEFHQNPELARLFGFVELVDSPRYLQRFNEIFDRLGVSNTHEITLDEFLLFFEKYTKSMNKVEKPVHASPIKKDKSPKKVIHKKQSASAKSLHSEKENQPICLIPHKHMVKLEDIFNSLDMHQDYVVRRGELIDTMMQDPKIIKILHLDALRISNFQVLDLESMLTYIKNDGDGDEEFITWNQFLEYFFVQPIFEEGKFNDILNPQLDEIDLPAKYMAKIQEIFEGLPKQSFNKVSTYDFVKAIKFDPETSGILDYTARIPKNLSHIPEETVENVLNRIQETADSLVSWVDVIAYFSKRGLPKDSNVGEALVTKNSFVKAKMPSKPVHENAVQTDYIESKKNTSRSRSISPRPRVTFEERSIEKTVTIPEPFGFEEREKSKKKSIRERKIEQMVKEKEDEILYHINYRVKPKEIPEEVSQPKFDNLRQALQERSEQVKRESAERTKQLERPFSFYIREKEKVRKSPSPEPEYIFKANPIPWACTVPLYETKLKEDEAKREERKSRAAQKDLRKASLPPRMEMYQNIKKNQFIENRTPSPKFRVKEPPNFEKLHERFSKTLEAKKKAKQTTELMPFNIDVRVQEADKRKEEKRRLKEVKRLEEEKKRLEEEKKVQEVRKAERMKAKEKWKAEHESIKAAKSASSRQKTEEKKLSPGRKKPESGSKDFNLSDLSPSGFTKKDLKSPSISTESLKPDAKKSNLRPTSGQKKPDLAPNKNPTPKKTIDLAPDNKSSSSTPVSRSSRNQSTKSDPNLAPADKPFTEKDLDLPPSKYPPLSSNLKSIPEESKNPLAPNKNVLAPDKNALAPNPNPLAPNPNPLAPNSNTLKGNTNPLAPGNSNKTGALTGTTSSFKKASTGKTANKSPIRKDPKAGTSEINKNMSYENSIKPKLKTVISNEEQRAAQDKRDISDKLARKQEEERNQALQYQQKLREMQERVSQRPLLVESATDTSSKNRSKMKVLLQIKKSLQESGIKYETYFTEEELDLIQEAEYMTKMNRLK